MRRPLTSDIIRVYAKDRHGNTIYSLQNQYGTHKRMLDAKGLVIPKPQPLAEVKDWMTRMEERKEGDQ